MMSFVLFLFLPGTHPFSAEEVLRLIESRSFDQARPLLEEACKLAENKAQATLLLCRLETEAGAYEKGISLGREAVKLNPQQAEAHFRFAIALREKLRQEGGAGAIMILGDYKKALKRAIELDARHLGALHEEIAYLLSFPAMAGGDPQKAEEKAKALQVLDRRRGTSALADVYTHTKRWDLARDAQKALLQLDPQDMDLHYRYARSLQELKDYRGADSVLSALLSIQDAHLRALALYQSARSKILGNYELEKAGELLDAYLVLRPGVTQQADLPSDAAAHWRKGNIQEKLGHLKEAEASYRRSLALDPDFKEAAESLKKLRKGR